MKHVLLALVVVMEFSRTGFAQAQAPGQEMGAAADIQAVISAQMDAFRGDDFVQAFSFAAENIQRLFGTSDNFAVMVKRGYPMVHRAEDVRFGALRPEGNALWQRVLVRDAQGVVHVLEYLMISDGESWRIAAVQLLQPSDVGA